MSNIYTIVIIFIEFDSLALSRGKGDDCLQSRRLLSEILIQLTQLKITRQQSDTLETGNTTIIAATNRLEDLDEAILRRFDVKIFVGFPEYSTRERLIRSFLADISCSISAEEIHYISERTDGWSGSDIEVTVTATDG